MAQTTQVTDPYASIATPVQAAASVSPSDPYADIATPIAAAPGTTGVTGALNKVGEFGAGVIPGAVESMGETIQSLPWVGKKIISPEAMQAEREYFRPGSPAEKVGQETGAIAESALEFVLGDEALKGLALAKKIGLASQIAKIAQDSPYIGKIIQHGVNAARMGTVGATEALAKGATPGQAAETGVATGIGGEAISAVAEAVPSAIKALRGFKNPFRKAMQEIVEGKGIAQPAAQAAVRGAVGAGAEVPILQGAQTALDDPLASLATKEKAAYKVVDDKVGFDLKEAKLQLKNDQYTVKQPGLTVTARKELQDTIAANNQRIAWAETDLKTAGIDPKAADALHTARMAGLDFKNALVRSANPDGTLDMNKLLNQSKTLRFSKRGDRLAQFFGQGDIQVGKIAAGKYMDQLAVAQKAGVVAVRKQQIAKWIGVTIVGGGIAGEIIKQVLP